MGPVPSPDGPLVRGPRAARPQRPGIGVGRGPGGPCHPLGHRWGYPRLTRGPLHRPSPPKKKKSNNRHTTADDVCTAREVGRAGVGRTILWTRVVLNGKKKVFRNQYS